MNSPNAPHRHLVTSPHQSSISFDLLGQTIVVESESPGFLWDLRHCFEDVSPCPSGEDLSADLYVWVTATLDSSQEAEPRFRVRSRPEGALPTQTPRAPGGAASLGRGLVQWAVDSTRNYYVLHAGAVAREGRGILLPGPSHSGKSTLTVALAQRGFGILSDEVGAISVNDGTQTAFGRAFSIRTAVVADLGIDREPRFKILDGDAQIFLAETLGLSRASTARPALVVLPTYREDGPTRLHRLRPAAAVVALFEASCSQRRWKVAGLDLLIELATSVPCFELRYSDMHDAAAAIEKTFTEFCYSERCAVPIWSLSRAERGPSP